MTSKTSAPQAADLFNDLEPEPVQRWTDVLPGVVVAALATMAAGVRRGPLRRAAHPHGASDRPCA